MRAFFSYSLALCILLLAGGWLATGTLVQGGQGPGNGEKPIVSVIEGEENGPIGTALADAGVLAHPHEPEIDPTLTLLRDNLLETPTDPRDVYAHERMSEMLELIEMSTAWFDEVQRLPPETLQNLMKLGSKVQKVLGIAGKLRGKT